MRSCDCSGKKPSVSGKAHSDPVKYHSRPTVVDGIRFASQREANRYQELLYLLQAGSIQDLVLQVRYPLLVAGQKVAVYVADFVYRADDQDVVEDAKGVRTPVYRLKAKMFQAQYGYAIREV